MNGQCVGCPAGTKLVNKTCISNLESCTGGRIFNTTTSECNCPTGTFYDVSIERCTQCGQNQFFNGTAESCQYCPPSAPLLYNGKCAVCPNGTHYDAEESQCLACPDSFVYNPSNDSCVCPPEQPYQ